MKYSVRLNNISENDQLVLRLIFSLSEKARGRSHSFQLSATEGQDADIRIVQFSDAEQPPIAGEADIVLVDTQQPASSSFAYQIHKPLIASRILCLLDRYVQDHPRDNLTSPTTTVSSAPVEANAEMGQPAELDFCISEEEASELAIVDDETLSNPSNTDILPSAYPDAAADEGHTGSASITSLVVRHKNKELEVSAQAYKTRSIAPAPARPRALVVDDSPSVRKQIELELELFNVEIDLADSVANARVRLADQHYDVAFLDVVLPDGDGFSICQHIKGNSRETRVIMLTGKATAADKIKGTMAGCDAYLVKPVGRMTFQNTVCKYLQLREQLEIIHSQTNPY